jgi:hypothetical protein
VPTVDSFEILAEVAIGIAGFSSIAVVLSRSPGEWVAADSFRTLLLLLMSFGTLILALVPIGLGTADLPPETIWRISSGFVVAVNLGSTAVIVPVRRRQLDRSLWFGPITLTVTWSLFGAHMLAQTLNCLGALFDPNPTVLFFGLVWQLAFSAFIFARIVFVRPTPDPQQAGRRSAPQDTPSPAEPEAW